jgi:GTPase SAR1 family protein
MPDPTTTTVPKPTAPRSALRVVLFGMPDAGKSSLLGALGQAAQTQEHVLNGHLTDLGRGLAEMQRRLYDEVGRSTAEEVIPFPVAFTPFSGKERLDAVLIDCDGRVANDLLSRKRELEGKAGGELGQAIRQADAVIFLVDVSARESQIDADLTECSRFLARLEEGRGHRVEVGGMPVFLVLTKCDLLARPGDDLAAWVEKVEQRKREVGGRFQTFLDRQSREGALPFGSIMLNVWATAVKRPELADSPAKPREPYGVAELFRQGFARAHEHRQRAGQSSRRLISVILAALIGLGVLATIPAIFILNRPSEQATDLAGQVQQFRSREQELAPAARYRQTQDRIDRLYAIRRDAAYPQLSDELKGFVESRLKDLEEYDALAAEADGLPDPRAIHDEAKLKEGLTAIDRVRKKVEAHADWKSSDADRALEQRHEDAVAIEKAVQSTVTGYEKVIADGRQVLKESEKPNLPSRARKALDAASALPNPKIDATKLLPNSERVTYTVVFGYDRVKDALRRWQAVQKELELPASLIKP